MNSIKPTLAVAARWQEATDIVAFRLVDPQGRELPAFTAGAHVDLEIAPGLVRQFSIFSSPSRREAYEIAVLRDSASRGGSKRLIDAVAVGDCLRASLPKNNFELDPAAERTVLIAGGIGITPILCMAERLARDGRAFELHYATRSRARAAFLRRIEESSYRDVARLYFSEDAGRRLELDTVIPPPDEATHLYVCGPARLIDAVLGKTAAAGWPAAQVHRELFAAFEVRGPVTGQAFDVQIASSGKVLHVPEDRTIGKVLLENGVGVEMTCEEGICGSCLTGVLAGEPEHRDLYLTPEQQSRNDQMAVCCSRSKTRLLVLDL